MPVVGASRRSAAGSPGSCSSVLVLAILVTAFVIAAAYARRGYHVAFDEDGEVVIYQGRDFLWFEPTVEGDVPATTATSSTTTRSSASSASPSSPTAATPRTSSTSRCRPTTTDHDDDDHDHHDDDHDHDVDHDDAPSRDRRRRARRPRRRARRRRASGADGDGLSPRPGPTLDRAVARRDGRDDHGRSPTRSPRSASTRRSRRGSSRSC